jgi:hypothetical protein
MLRDAVLIHIPRADGRARAVTRDFKRCPLVGIGTLPDAAEKRFVVREDNNLRRAVSEPAYLLDGCERAMLVQAVDRIVDDDDLSGERGVLVE